MDATENKDDNPLTKWFRMSYHTIHGMILDAYKEISEAISVMEDACPDWFNLKPFLKYSGQYYCILYIARYSLRLLGCIVFAYCCIKNILEERLTTKDKTQCSDDLTASTLSDKNPMKIVMTDAVFQIGLALATFGLPFELVMLIIFCKSLSLNELFRNKDFMTLPRLMHLAVELDSKLDAPNPVLVTFFNEELQKLLPHITGHKSFEQCVTESIPESVRSKLNLYSVKVLRELGKKDAITVPAVKIVEMTPWNVVIDVNVLYVGNYVGSALWSLNEQIRFHSFQVDAKLRLKLTPRQETGVYQSIHISLKKINKLDAWHEDIASRWEQSNPMRKKFLKGVEEVLPNYFPLELSMISEETNVHLNNAQTERNNLPRETAADIFQRAADQRQGATSSSILANNTKPTTRSLMNPTAAAASNAYAAAVAAALEARTAVPATRQVATAVAASEAKAPAPTQAATIAAATNTAAVVPAPITNSAQRVDSADSSTTKQRDTLTVNPMKSSPSAPYSNASGISITPTRVQIPGQTTKQESASGSIDLTLHFQPSGNLVVTIHGLRNLPKIRGRTPNPFVKLVLQCLGEPEQKETTDKREKTTDPIFEKTLEFYVTKPLLEYTLRITARSQHTLAHTLSQAVVNFIPSTRQVIKERDWHDLASPKTQRIIHVEYKEAAKYV